MYIYTYHYVMENRNLMGDHATTCNMKVPLEYFKSYYYKINCKNSVIIRGLYNIKPILVIMFAVFLIKYIENISM